MWPPCKTEGRRTGHTRSPARLLSTTGVRPCAVCMRATESSGRARGGGGGCCQQAAGWCTGGGVRNKGAAEDAGMKGMEGMWSRMPAGRGGA